jgi:hypothetical protein
VSGRFLTFSGYCLEDETARNHGLFEGGMLMKRLFIIMAAFILVMASTAQASPIVVQFSGYIDRIEDDDHLLDETGITVGSSTFSGQFGYDSESNPVSLGCGTYGCNATYIMDSFAITVQTAGEDHQWIAQEIGGKPTMYLSSNSLDVCDECPVWETAPSFFGRYWEQEATPPEYGPDFHSMQFSLINGSGEEPIGTNLPISLDLTDFDQAYVLLFGDTFDPYLTRYSYQIMGSISEVNVIHAPVPVPATILLFASGLIGLAGLRKRLKM